MSKIQRRSLLAVTASMPLIGCTVVPAVDRAATAVGGESVSYNFRVFSRFALEGMRANMPGRRDLTTGVIYSYSARQESSIDRMSELGVVALISFGSYQFSYSSGHKIPEEVEVSWHEPPAPGGKMYSGPFRGPYRVAVRSRIPPDVLKQIRTDDRVLCISFGVGGEKVLLNWALVEYDDKPRLARERKILQYGGDSF